MLATLRPTAHITITDPLPCFPDDVAHLAVNVVWVGAKIDRPYTGGFGLKLSHRRLAERLVRAIEGGAVFIDAKIRTDVNGKTYVSATSRVLSRTLNADLKRLGF